MTSGASAPCAARLSLVLLETGCGSSAALRRRDDNAVGQGGRPQSTSGLAPAARPRSPAAAAGTRRTGVADGRRRMGGTGQYA